MSRNEESFRRSDRGRISSFMRPFRGVITIGCGLSAVLIAAVVGDGLSDDRHMIGQPASIHTAATKRSEAPLDVLRRQASRFTEELFSDIACDAGGTGDGAWFEWVRLLRNHPSSEIDPENELAFFGISVDVSGNVAAVGASQQMVVVEFDDDDDDDNGDDENGDEVEVFGAGTVYIYRFNENENDWVKVATIEPPTESLEFGGIRFGRSVAVASSPNEDIVVIGAPDEAFLIVDPDTGEVTGGLPLAGAVYVYRRTGPTWPAVEEEEWALMPAVNRNFHVDVDNPHLYLSNRLHNDFPFETARFGHAVDILPFRQTSEGDWVGGDVIVVGEPTGVAFPHCETDGDPGLFSGTGTIFRLGGELPEGTPWPGRWVHEETIIADCEPFEFFGVSLDIEYSIDRQRLVILVGAERGRAEIENPKDPDDPELIFSAGIALLFEYDPPEDEEDGVAFRRFRSGSVLDGDDEKEPEPEPNWKRVDRFQSPHPRPLELFGRSVALSSSPVANDVVAVGSVLTHAFVDDATGNPIGGTETEEGAVFVFRREFVSEAAVDDQEYEWEPDGKLISLDPQFRGWFGSSVGAFGNTIVVGAPREDDPDDGTLQAVGFAYVFSYSSDSEEWDTIGEQLLPHDHISEPFDQFGAVVAVHGSVILVGGPNINGVANIEDDKGEEVEVDVQSVGAAFTYGRCYDCESPQSCFEPGPAPGCANPICCNLVCQFDPFCCETAWDQRCVDVAVSMPDQCITPVENCPAFGSCCEVRGDPGCNNDDCCLDVCAIDPLCCELSWDPCCVALAGELCGGICPDVAPTCEGFCGVEDADGCPGTCSCAEDCIDPDTPDCCPDVCFFCHDDPDNDFSWCPDCPTVGSCCEARETAGCEDPACCFTVCAIDPTCCDDEWGPCCAALAGELCGDTCPDAALSCDEQCNEDDAHECGICSCAPDCGENGNLPCCDDVCEFCEEEPGFELLCPGDPPLNCPGLGSCCQANGSPGCSDQGCCQAVCAEDSACCDVDWDECCARLAEELCGVCPVTPDPTCEGLCGLDDVDGCGTCSCHSDCVFFGDCCEDVCDHCGGEAGFEWCPPLPPPDRGRPSPRPKSPDDETAAHPRATLPVGRVEKDQSPGVSSTAPNRR